MLPVPTLLSRALGRLTAEAEASAGGDMPALPVWSNVLRCLADGDLPEPDLAAAARVSKRLAAAAITTVAKAGWISAVPAGGKARLLSLTEAGASAATRWPASLAALDRAWAGTPLRRTLEEVVRRVPYELPHFPASYGTADPSAIGGPYMQGVKRADGVLAHGNDWKPVARGDGDTVSALPITALLSQALMAFTIDYEDRFPWPLASTANVLVHIGTTPTPLKQLPAKHGITGKGKSLLERHLIVTVSKEGVVLTERGEQVLKHHPARLEATESLWRDRYGDDPIDALREALTELGSDARDHPAHLIWAGGY